MAFLIWSADPPPGHCTLSGGCGCLGLDAHLDMQAGLEVPAPARGAATLQMSDLFPDDTQLSDNFETASGIVVSARMRRRLAKATQGEPIAYLPVSILDHKGRVAADDYAIVHPLGAVDCIDLKASKAKMLVLDKQTVSSCRSLVFRPGSLPTDRSVFRMRQWGSHLVITETLARVLVDAGFTGLHFWCTDGFNGTDGTAWTP